MGIFNRWGSIVLIIALLSLATTVTAATGTIQINVHPGGGTVCIDTTCKGNPGTADGTSSISFENVEAGSYHMVNVYGTPGYKAWLGQIFLDPSGTSLTRDIWLEPLPAQAPETGTVRIFITPDGGRVCLDRMCELSRGDGTGSWSVEFTDITANTNHTLTVANEGYNTFTFDVRLLPGQTDTLSVILKPLPPGNTTSPTPIPLPTTEPQPTQAGLPGVIALLAIGICGVVLVLGRRGQE
jgi:hypothetical protein